MNDLLKALDSAESGGRRVRFSESVGRTIAGVCYDVSPAMALVTFTDGTFSTIEISWGYEHGDEELCDGDAIDPTAPSLVTLGILSESEVLLYQQRLRAAREMDLERREREQYERLRAKFDE